MPAMFAAALAVLIGAAIAAVLQTRASEANATSLPALVRRIADLRALELRLGDARILAGRLASQYSEEEAAHCRAEISNARQAAVRLGLAKGFGEPDTLDLGPKRASADSDGAALTTLDLRLAQAVRNALERDDSLLLRRIETQRATIAAARVLLNLTLALALFLLGLTAWRNIVGIKESNAARSSLASKEEHYRQVIEMAGDLICRTDRWGRFTFCNSAALSLLRLTENEVIGRSWLKLVRQDKRAEARRFYRRQFAGMRPNTYFEFPVIDGHGRERWLGQNVQLVLDQGKASAFQAIAREITERKTAESESEKARAVVDRIAERVPGVLYVYDIEERKYLFQRGRLSTDLRFHPDDLAAVRRHHEILRYAAEGEVRYIEFRAMNSDRRWTRLSARDTPFERAPNGLVRRIVGIAQEISAPCETLPSALIPEETPRTCSPLPEPSRGVAASTDRPRCSAAAAL